MELRIRKSIVIFGVVSLCIAICVFLTVAVERPKSEKDASSWKTYRNEEYGFEFRYPNDKNDPSVQKDGRICTVGFCVKVNQEDTGFLGLRKKISDDKKNLLVWYIAVNGKIGYAYTLKDGDGMEKILLSNQDKTFTLSSGYRVDRDILATFKFLK